MVNVIVMADLTGTSLAARSAADLAGVRKLAGYVTGSGGIAWTAQQFTAAATAHGVVRIDQSPGLAEFAAGRADVADIEAMAGTPASFVAAMKVRVAGGHGAGCAYGTDGVLASIAADLAAAGVAVRPDCWLANWNLNLAGASALIGTDVHGMLCQAVQWASPTSNPRTFLPGTTLTLLAANVDLSAADVSWPAGSAVTVPMVSVSLPLLAQGASGNAVRHVQMLLTAAGHPLVIDGQFGPLTAAALKAATGEVVVDGRAWGMLLLS